MLRSMVTAAMLALVLGASVFSASAQAPAGFRGPVFRVEPETRSEFRRTGYVTGWIYNDGQGVAGLVKMKCQMLDEAGKVVAEHVGWAYGNVMPGGRAYFMIPIPPKSAPERRVTVDSWVIQSYSTAESP